MKRIDEDFKDYIGQGENSDLLVSVANFDRKFDQFFGIDYLEGEKGVKREDDFIYPGLADTALLTSYLDYFQIYEDIPIGATLVDLGAGYCRGSLLFQKLGEKRCVSVECEKSRAEAALSLNPADIIVGDLLNSNFKLPEAGYYFIYLPQGKVLYETIKKIIEQRIEATFYIIESHGDLVDYFNMQINIFSLLEKPFKTSLPRHKPFIYKFKSKKLEIDKANLNLEKDLPLWHLYNYDKELKLTVESKVPGSEQSNVWSGEISGSTLINYNGKNSLYLEKPSRVIQLETQDRILAVTR